ncbi:uncharacterized protein LOC129717225 [Wyeomyia smithii]|uniref:uncharacterized protein LOC129717225 n=1 Tax=Wyeomyia smithii TaxID=174621 RepID=UPI0024681A12|nr:uncharacterized protein LOC129717225 [Wyeomyia smithii]
MDGTLIWPKKTVVWRLCHDENSQPSENWEKISCVLKREFDTYAEAQQELDYMELNTETEMDEQPEAKKVCRRNAPTSIEKDFNDLVTDPQELETVTVISGEQIALPNVDVSEDEQSAMEENITEAHLTEIEINEIIPEASLTAIVTNQVLMHNNKLKIMISLAKLTASIEVLNQKVLSMEKNYQTEPHASTEDVMIKIVDSIEDLDRLEAELRDENNMERYITKLSAICGKTGKSDGVTSAYRLIDHLVTCEMMNKCSWTRLARDIDLPSSSKKPCAGTPKIPLKFYAKFREMFLRVVRLADQDFSEADCEKFLKGIMKNSKQRLTGKVVSTHKNRPKNLKYGDKKNELK